MLRETAEAPVLKKKEKKLPVANFIDLVCCTITGVQKNNYRPVRRFYSTDLMSICRLMAQNPCLRVTQFCATIVHHLRLQEIPISISCSGRFASASLPPF